MTSDGKNEFDLQKKKPAGEAGQRRKTENDSGSGKPAADESAIDRPRLTPQGRTDPSGSGDDTAPGGGAARGQPDKPEG